VGPWYYETSVLGFNYRLSDVHSALGLSQMRKLPGFLGRRRALAARYDEAFARCASDGRSSR
jgi:dTDP-4-amino-4,6-dideoxygalactose transaminase